MLGGARLRVGFSREKNCFAYVSSAYSSTSDRSQCIQLLWRGSPILLWVVNSAAVPEGQIWINPIHCRLLTLEEGVDIYVAPYSDVKILDELYIETDSPDDQEIVEQNAELLQLNLLDQLRLVVKNQKTIVWITTSLPIVFTPKQTGILVNHSMVIVKIDAFMHSPYKLHHSTEKVTQEKKKTFNNVEIILDGLLKPYYNIPETLVLRVFPIDGDGRKNMVHPFKVFIHENLVPKKYNNGKIVLANLEVIPSVVTDNRSSDDNTASGTTACVPLCVQIIPIDYIIFKSLSHEVFNEFIPTALIPQSLNNILGLEKGDSVILSFNCEVVQPEQIQIVAYINENQSEDEITTKFKQCVVECSNAGNTFLLNDGVPVQEKQICNGVFTVKLRPDKLKFTVLNSESLRNCSVSAKCLDKLEIPPKIKRSKNEIEYESRNYCRTIDCVEKLVSKTLQYFEFEIFREVCFKGASEVKGNVLITGLSGSGKSSLCQILANSTTFWSHTLQCRTLRGRKDIPEILGAAILMCQEHSPSVLLCDDLDALVPSDTEGAAPQDIAYYNRLAVVMKHMLQTCSGVCVGMTAINVKSLHPVLREFSGRPMFTAHLEIPELQQQERQTFLNHLLNQNIRNDFYIDEDSITRMAMATSGQTLRDLLDYVNRKIFKAVKKKYAHPSDKMIPRLVEDESSSSDSKDEFDVWGALGGMEDVKQELTECIFWPMMYPALFPSQSCGILLFGPPGTGKSFIGSCLAKLANMNFVSVKGPELLSKYIGQSEKAVRDIFDKADMKRPCILFFDEFDSLAPKRGHDSTGVTDRVVNQLLVRLDGAEGGARGPVLAATSRPDLIDPALLRPGRLYRHIYCALPDKKGRAQVLRTLSQSVHISKEVDLTDIADRTKGFSPADLKSLLVTAQLTCLEKKLEIAESETPDSVIVQPEDMESALLETKPSLSQQQRLFYSMIYKRFRGEKLTNEEIAEAQRPQHQRVTLA